MLLFETNTQLLFGGLVTCYLRNKTNHTGVEMGHMSHLQYVIHTHEATTGIVSRALQRKGNLTLHHLMELFHKLCAVLLGDTCKPHCTEEDLPGALVTMSLPPLVQPLLNGLFLVKARGSIALFNCLWVKPNPLQDGPTFTYTLSADILSEEHSISLTSCKGDKRWALLSKPCNLSTAPGTQQWGCLCSASLNSTQVHMFTHSALAVRGQGPSQWELPHLHTTDEQSWNGNWWH